MRWHCWRRACQNRRNGVDSQRSECLKSWWISLGGMLYYVILVFKRSSIITHVTYISNRNAAFWRICISPMRRNDFLSHKIQTSRHEILEMFALWSTQSTFSPLSKSECCAENYFLAQKSRAVREQIFTPCVHGMYRHNSEYIFCWKSFAYAPFQTQTWL